MITNIDTKSVFKFTLPTIGAMVFMGFYTMVDGFFVANFLGVIPLSAVNITFPTMSVFLAIGAMLGMGGSAVCATLLGEGNGKEAKEKATLFIATGLGLGIFISVIGIFYLKEILYFLGANEETYGYAYDYLFYILLFAPFVIGQIIIENAMIASGRPHLSFITILAGGLTNIILDYVFIKLGLAMAGVGLATGLGFFVPCFIGFIFFGTNKRHKTLHFTKFSFDLRAILKASGNGSSEMVTMLSTSVIVYLFNITMLDLVGNVGVAAITVILYAQMFGNTLFVGYTVGIAPVISYNYGDRNIKNLRALFKLNIKFVTFCSVLLFLLAISLSDKIVAVFAAQGTETNRYAIEGMLLFSFSFLFSGFNIFASGMFTAYSNGKVSAFISFLRTFFFIIISLLTLPKIIGLKGVWLAVPIAEVCSFFVVLYFLYAYKDVYMYAKSNSLAQDKLSCRC